MGRAALTKGQFVQIDGCTYRLFRKLEEGQWQLEETLTGKISDWTADNMLALYGQRRMIFVPSDLAKRAVPANAKNVGTALASPSPIHNAIEEKYLPVVKERRAYVLPTLDQASVRSAIAPLINEVWEKLGRRSKCPSTSTVLRWKRAYLNAGRDPASLVPHTALKGNRTARPVGRLSEMAETLIDDKYLTKERPSAQDILDLLIAQVNRENKTLPTSMQLPRPTRRFIRRMIEKIPAYDRDVARHGKIQAERRYRSSLGQIVADEPLKRAEIDHTRMDLMVICDETGVPMGRPWLTVCIDVHSRCILGVFISFEPPSFFSVSRCLRHAILPKIDLKQKYPDVEREWLPYGIMTDLWVDNGVEFHSQSLEDVCVRLNITLRYSKRRHPWSKPIVERVIKEILRGTTHGVPGTTFSNIFERDDYDPTKHAVIRYSTLKKIVHKWIADVYHYRPHRGLNKKAPIQVWNSSIQQELQELPADVNEFDAIFGRSDVRSLRHTGIELDGLFYNSSDLKNLRMKHGEKFDVEIRIDDSDIGHIIVLSPDKKYSYRVPAKRQDYAAGLSRYQHSIIKRYSAKHDKSDDPDGWLESKLQIAEIVENEIATGRRKRPNARASRYLDRSPQLARTEEATETETLPATVPQATVYDAVPASTSSARSTCPTGEVPGEGEEGHVLTPSKSKRRLRFKPQVRRREIHADDGKQEGDQA